MGPFRRDAFLKKSTVGRAVESTNGDGWTDSGCGGRTRRRVACLRMSVRLVGMSPENLSTGDSVNRSWALRITHPVTLAGLLLVLLAGATATGQTTRGRITSGGFERFRENRWGLVRGHFENKTDEPETITSLAHQVGGDQHQYGRRIVLPPKSIRTSQWPLFVHPAQSGAFEFEYMSVTGEAGRETITRRGNGEMLDGFVVSAIGQQNGMSVGSSMTVYSSDTSAREILFSDDLISSLRDDAQQPPKLIAIRESDIGVHPEALNTADQMIICSSQLHRHPDVCVALRHWVERGGRVIVSVNATGEESARALLGDALPFSVVDETSLMDLDLKHHVETGGLRQEADLSYTRSFDEPVPFSRVVVEKGNLLWSANGWPLLVQQDIGRGRVYLSTASAEVYMQGLNSHKTAPTTAQILEDSFLTTLPPPLLADKDMSEIAHSEIGYEIPQRSFPLLVLTVFVLLLAGLGVWLVRSDRHSWMTIAAPVLAVLAAVPGLALGLAVRTAAPPTLLETRVVHAAAGQTSLVADGIATVYQPDAQDIGLTLHDYATLRTFDSTPADTRHRFIWTDMGTHEWADFHQPAGISDYVLTSSLQLPTPLTSRAVLDEKGVQLSISNTALLQPEDAILASRSPDIMAARQVDAQQWRTESADILMPGEISNETMLNQRQVQRKKLYQTLFNHADRLKAFPEELSVLFWSQQLPSQIETETEMRRQSSTLLVVPVDLTPPAVGQQVLLPPVLLPYQTIASDTGGVSSAFFNRRRNWIEVSKGVLTVLKFDLPSACVPFRFQDVSVRLRIRAGSRDVAVAVGGPGQWEPLQTLSSPVGTFELDLPVDTLNRISGQSVYLKIDVSDSQIESDQDDPTQYGEQDNYWKIESVQMTASGARLPSENSEDSGNTE